MSAIIHNPATGSLNLNKQEADEEIRILSKQGGAIIKEHDACYITKEGRRVRRAEEVAMRLVQERTDVPVPEVLYSIYQGLIGHIGMSIAPGSTLEYVWSQLNDDMKAHVCGEIWGMIGKWRKIPGT